MKKQCSIFIILFSLFTHQNNFNVEMMMKKILAASLVVAFVLTGCNTFKGVGKDVSSAGDAVTNTAQKTQDKL
jgi:predicted small secreted protein